MAHIRLREGPDPLSKPTSNYYTDENGKIQYRYIVPDNGQGTIKPMNGPIDIVYFKNYKWPTQ